MTDPTPAAPPSVLTGAPVYTILLSIDLEASRHFYGDLLGLRLLRQDIDEHDARLVYEAGEGTRLVLSRSTVGTSDMQTQAAFRVPDIRAAIVELRARGVRIEEYVAPDPVTHDGVADMGHSWAAWFIDPSRNCIAIIQAKD
jgi:catechol 2,3-dioxygenase-like lactoylglutathione lyase family enzyme